MKKEMEKPVLVVGAGMAGLQAAYRLYSQSIPFVLLEKSDRVGGRIQSDHLEGFILDHGFQVLQTSYLGVQQNLDLAKLDLSYFQSGAYLYQNDRFYPFLNPLNNPFELFKSYFAGILTLGDIGKLAVLWLKVQGNIRPMMPTQMNVLRYLEKWNFSPGFYNKFIYPFFAGVFLDPNLDQPSSLFDYYLKQFLDGKAALPKHGMSDIPLQLSARLPKESIKFNQEIIEIYEEYVVFSSGEKLAYSQLIMATDAKSASQLLQVDFPKSSFLRVKTFYFSADEFPNSLPLLNLIPKGLSDILHFSCLSNVNPNYAPKDKKLISVSSLNHQIGDQEIVSELIRFTGKLKGLKFLKVYDIPFALPKVGAFIELELAAKQKNIELIGDYVSFPSLQAAFEER
ncbi:protoporphyrinogen/coproporphyrinogen oxidase [Aquirufa sp. ROCK2-A2]